MTLRIVAGGCSLDAKGILEDNVFKKYFSGVRRRSQFITRSSASGVEGRPDGEHEREMKIHLDRIVFSSQAPWKLTGVEGRWSVGGSGEGVGGSLAI